jgi:hypothetical protein
MKKTRIELSCPACGKTRVVELRLSERFLRGLLAEDGYMFRGDFDCACGKAVLATLQVSALDARRGRGAGGEL